MAVECTRDNLMELAKCFTGLSKPQVEGIKAYLMAIAAGVEPDRDTLITASECFRGLGLPQLMGIQTYLLCQIANAEPGNVDGLIWGPTPETVDSINASVDSLVTAFDTLFNGIELYTTYSFGNPTTVTNGVDFSGGSVITSLEFRLLESVGADFNFNINSLTSFSAPLLQTVGGAVDFGGSTALINLTLPALISCDSVAVDSGAIEVLSLPVLPTYPPSGISADASLLTLNLPACVDDGAGQLNTDLAVMTGLVTLNLNSLTTYSVDWNVDINPQLSSLNIDSLQHVVGGLAIGGTQLTAWNSPALVTIDTNFSLGQPVMVSVSCPSLVTIGVNVAFNGSTNLTSFSAPAWVPTDGTSVDFNGCALDIPSVELILRRLVLAGVVACTIDLSGGTNAGTASLSAQGQADVATLGAQLTMNP